MTEDGTTEGAREVPVWELIPSLEAWPTADLESATRPGLRRKRALLWSTLTVTAVSAVTAGILVTSTRGPSVPGAGIAPTAFVVSSTQDTLAQRTADVVFSGSISASGQTIPLGGSGQANFATNAFTGTVSFATSGLSIVERELAVGGHFYMGLTTNGSDMSAITGGPEWVTIPVPSQGDSSGLGFGSVNPLSQIQLLEQKGATVVALGTSVIDGDLVSGYSVTPSRTEDFESIEKEIASGQIPASQVQTVLDAAKTLGTFTQDVWFDSSGLLRRESVKMSGGSSGATGTIYMTFKNFGTSVDIEPPPSGDTVSFTQFSSDLQALEASGS